MKADSDKKARTYLRLPGLGIFFDELSSWRKPAVISFIVILIYLLIVFYIYAVEFFNVNSAVVSWDQVVGNSYERPSIRNLLGTDYLGRSVLRKTLYAAKVSITVAFLASVVSLGIGVCLGAVAGFFRGILDDIVVWLISTLGSIPYVLLVTAFALVLKGKTIDLRFLGLGSFGLSGTVAVCLAIGLTGWTGVCRLVRAEVLKQKSLQYVVSAKAFGFSNLRIIARHIVPNIIHIISTLFVIRFVYYINAEVILSFLGLGAKGVPSWGTMLDSARLDLTRGCWWEMAAATGAVFIISLALNIFGSALQQRLDPQLRMYNL